MNVVILGAGMMGRAIAYAYHRWAHFDTITIADNTLETLRSAQKLLPRSVVAKQVHLDRSKEVSSIFSQADIVVSAVPYRFNLQLAQTAIRTGVHFVDLGGNNTIVKKELALSKQAQKNNVTIIPDCGLAPGLVSVITKDIVEHLDTVESVKLRVGGLPVHPQPPLQYQIVFSPYGLINEYVEDAIILDHGTIKTVPSMTQLETLRFPKPFGILEAFLTSGGCSTLPSTYKDVIGYLDYKTIRYPGHCEKIKTFLDLGLASEKELRIGTQNVKPRDVFVALLLDLLPTKGRDVVLMNVLGKGRKQNQDSEFEYSLIDYGDPSNHISAMMRTTGYPAAITAQMIAEGIITQRGVFCSEQVIPCAEFFTELSKRGMKLSRRMH